MIKNEHGDLIFLSNDGVRRFRFDMKHTYPHSSPHWHLEEFVNSKWVKSGPIYPVDAPHN
jgi:hypothetical protein